MIDYDCGCDDGDHLVVHRVRHVAVHHDHHHQFLPSYNVFVPLFSMISISNDVVGAVVEGFDQIFSVLESGRKIYVSAVAVVVVVVVDIFVLFALETVAFERAVLQSMLPVQSLKHFAGRDEIYRLKFEHRFDENLHYTKHRVMDSMWN